MLGIIFPKANDFRRRMNRTTDSIFEDLAGIVNFSDLFRPVLSKKHFPDIRNLRKYLF